jgi:hypothetical protein
MLCHGRMAAYHGLWCMLAYSYGWRCFRGAIMTDTKHTPTPWRTEYSEHMNDYENEDWVIYSGDTCICSTNYYSTPGIEREEDAKFIIRACNSHDDLVAALEKAKEVLEDGDTRIASDFWGISKIIVDALEKAGGK